MLAKTTIHWWLSGIALVGLLIAVGIIVQAQSGSNVRAAVVGNTISDISLSPDSDTNTVGATHTVTALVTYDSGGSPAPVVGTTVSFEIIAGPHTGENGTDVTDGAGEATFSYVGTAAGTDTIEATFVDGAGNTQRSNRVQKDWVFPTPVPPTPTPVPPTPTPVPPTPTPEPPPEEVNIDIKPGSDPNSINCTNANETITVAILTTDDFDATTVDHTTVTFEGATETHVNNKTDEPRRHEEDVDEDGDTDLVFHFRLGDTGLSCSSTEGTLIGNTVDGQAIKGTDAVRMI